MSLEQSGEKVYLIDSGEWTKIGISKSPEERLQQIQIGNPTTANLTATIRSDDARAVEKLLHRYYWEFRSDSGGEWFNLPVDEHSELTSLSEITAEQAACQYGGVCESDDFAHSTTEIESESWGRFEERAADAARILRKEHDLTDAPKHELHSALISAALDELDEEDLANRVLAQRGVQSSGEIPYDQRDTESGKFTQKYTDEVFIEGVATLGGDGTQNIADEVDCDYDITYKRLRELEDDGVVTSRKIGNTRFWELPDDE